MIVKLYAYTYSADAILKEGYLSATRQNNPGILTVFKHKAKSDNPEDVAKYLESTFKGRLRSISCVTSLAPIKDYEHPYLDNLVKYAQIVSFDIYKMVKDGIVEAIYCKDCSETVKVDIDFENIYKVDGIGNIDFSELNWDNCSVEYGSPYNVIRHYMLVLKDGVIPPKYITREK